VGLSLREMGTGEKVGIIEKGRKGQGKKAGII
jgi:hypothetical protein